MRKCCIITYCLVFLGILNIQLIYAQSSTPDSTRFKGKRIISLTKNGQLIKFIEGEILIKIRDISDASEFWMDLSQKHPYSTIARNFDKTNFGKILIPSDKDIFSVLEDIQHNPFLEYACLNSIGETAAIPTDPNYPHQENIFNKMGFPLAWDLETGSETVVIGVLDSGIDLYHDDLENKVILGWDFIGNDAYPEEEFHHGTKVAGILGAETNNFGVAGSAWGNKMLIVKIVDSNDYFSVEDYRDAVYWIIDSSGFDVRIINASLQDNTNNSPVYNEVADFTATNNCLLILAAGNHKNTISYMARSEKVLAVGAADNETWQYSLLPNPHCIGRRIAIPKAGAWTPESTIGGS